MKCDPDFWKLAGAFWPDRVRWLFVDKDREQKQAIISVWEHALSDLTFDEANRAMQTLYANPERCPRDFNQFPNEIRRLAFAGKFQATAAVDRAREVRVRCLECRDTCQVICVHPKSLMRINAGAVFGDPGTRCTCAVLCSCEAADRRADLKRKHNEHIAIQRFDPDRWCRELLFVHEVDKPLRATKEEVTAHIRKWLDGFEQRKISGREWTPTKSYEEVTGR